MNDKTASERIRDARKDAPRVNDARAMSASHYRVIADILRRIDPGYKVVLAFADELEQSNPRFDRARFLQAIGPFYVEADADVRAGK